MANGSMTILIPTNFTDVSRHATDYAIRLFGDHLKRIVLLNAFEQPRIGRPLPLSLVDVIRRNSEKGLEEDRLRIIEAFPDAGFVVETKVVQAELSDSIRSAISGDTIDLIVMGSKGDVEFVDMFLESVTARVIKAIDHPMLIVPPIANLDSLDTIILTTDLKKITSPDILQPMIKLCQMASVSVKGLHITKTLPVDTGKVERMLQSMLGQLPFEFVVRRNSDIPTGIYKYIQETNADIVTLVKRKGAGSLVARFFHRNISRRIVKHVRQTLLLVTDQDYPNVS